jgi:hypothetical protein
VTFPFRVGPALLSVVAVLGLMTTAMLALVAATTAAAGGDSDPRPVSAQWTSGYPNSIAVLGHSGSTGENSDPKRPYVEARANSWATGTNPKVKSLYSRILARNPAIKGHNTSYSESGANVDRVGLQADRLLATDPKPDLIVIQVMDNDLTCPADRAALSDFRAKLTATLKKLAEGAPNSSEFVVSQFGSVPTYARTLVRRERAFIGGTGPCDFMTKRGGGVRKKIARLERAIHAYEGALKAACRKVSQCTYDGGAFGRVVDKRDYVSFDLNHFSITGHAKAAAVAWAAMRRAHVLPRSP